MKFQAVITSALVVAGISMVGAPASAARIKELVTVEGVRANHLVEIGRAHV